MIEQHSASYVNLNLTAIKLFYRWLEEKNYYTDIARNIRSLARDKNFKKIPLLPDQVKKLRAVCDDTTLKGARDKALINLLFSTGIRLGEALRLNTEDIYLEQSMIMIMGKGRSDKEPIRVPSVVMDQISHYLSIRTDSMDIVFKKYLTTNKGKIIEKNKEVREPIPVFIPHTRERLYGSKPKRLTVSAASQMIQRLLDKAGLKQKGISAHSLRHGAAVSLVLQGKSQYEVSVFLRHNSLEISRIYTRFAEKLLMQKNMPEDTLYSLIED
jgi:integrase/recombinase XerC